MTFGQCRSGENIAAHEQVFFSDAATLGVGKNALATLLCQMRLIDDSESAAKPAGEALAKLAILVAFYLYFAGWVYASTMFSEFGISLGVTDIPAYYFIVYAYGVFFRSLGGWLLLLSIASCWYVLGRISLPRAIEWLLAVMLTTVPFPITRTIAADRAVADAAYVRNGRAKTLQFCARPEKRDKYSQASLTAIENAKFRLILQTKERYYVFIQPKGDGRFLPAAKMYDIPAADFIAVVDLRNTEDR
jgi:hypothetical protein